MNETISSILSRRSVRKFRQEQISEEELQQILEAGRSAPSGSNNQASHLLVVQSPKILAQLKQLAVRRMAQLSYNAQTYPALRAAILRSRKGDWDFTYGAPTFVLVANKKGYGNNLVDSACVLENMMIAAQSLGIGSCYINNIKWLNEEEEMLAYLRGLGMGAEEIPCGGLSLGYSAVETIPAPKRTGNLVTRL